MTADGRQFFHGDGIDARDGRSFSAEATEEIGDALRLAFDFDGHAGGVIADVAGKLEFDSQAIDEGTKADALNDALDAHRAADRLGTGAGTHLGNPSMKVSIS